MFIKQTYLCYYLFMCTMQQYNTLQSFSEQQLADCDNINYGYYNKGW